MHKPTRMCINCKNKYYQSDLLRLKCIDKNIISWDKKGRSFYICNDCLNQEKQVLKSLYRVCKNKNSNYLSSLKEIVNKWKVK